MKGFLQRILQEIMKKNNTWNVRSLVDDSFVPSSKRPSVLYCKLTDLKSDFWDSTSTFQLQILSFFYKYLFNYPFLGSAISTIKIAFQGVQIKIELITVVITYNQYNQFWSIRTQSFVGIPQDTGSKKLDLFLIDLEI